MDWRGLSGAEGAASLSLKRPGSTGHPAALGEGVLVQRPRCGSLEGWKKVGVYQFGNGTRGATGSVQRHSDPDLECKTED